MDANALSTTLNYCGKHGREGGNSFLQTSKKVGIAEEGDGEIAKDRKV